MAKNVLVEVEKRGRKINCTCLITWKAKLSTEEDFVHVCVRTHKMWNEIPPEMSYRDSKRLMTLSRGKASLPQWHLSFLNTLVFNCVMDILVRLFLFLHVYCNYMGARLLGNNTSQQHVFSDALCLEDVPLRCQIIMFHLVFMYESSRRSSDLRLFQECTFLYLVQNTSICSESRFGVISSQST